MLKNSQSAKNVLEAHSLGFTVTREGDCISPYGNVLSPVKNRNGYLIFTFKRRDGVRKNRTVPVHQLQAFRKFGENLFCDTFFGVVVRHLNGDKTDNSWNNIAIGSPKDNTRDMGAEALQKIADAGGKSLRKLSIQQAENLRADSRRGLSYQELMKKYGLSKSAVSYIVNRKTYK